MIISVELEHGIYRSAIKSDGHQSATDYDRCFQYAAVAGNHINDFIPVGNQAVIFQILDIGMIWIQEMGWLEVSHNSAKLAFIQRIPLNIMHLYDDLKIIKKLCSLGAFRLIGVDI